MKKFFVGLLSVFLLLGASILTACGSNSIDMTLSTNTVSLQIKDESVTPEQIVVATVTGTDDTAISASAFGYEEIIDVRTEQSTDGRTLIYITGKDTEGYAEVLVRTHQGNVSSVITVDVYSEVSDMEQKTEETTKKNNYAIRGGSVELVENNLISFTPSANSRRTITWSLLDSSLPASIEGNVLTLGDAFSQDTITLVATTERGVTCNITLPVIDRLEEDLTMSWSYNRDNQAYELITQDNNTFNIVPNLATDEEYTGYIKLNFTQDLEVGYTVVTADGQVSDDLVINAAGEDNDGNLIFEVFANKNNANINEDFIIYFTIGYQDYNYSISTLETLPINVSVREKVNGIVISSDTIDNIAGTTQVLYSEYLNGHGEEYSVQITPTTVVDATRQYSISLRITNPNIPTGGLSAGCPVEFWYRDANNNNIWTQVIMEYDASQDRYMTRDNNMLTASTIYMKAASDITVQNFEGIEITFTSADNPDITNVFYAELVKSVSQDDFIFENANFRVDSSSSITDVSITKTFTLDGQTTTDGLYVVLNSENVTMTQPVYISSTADSVTFSITLTLNRSSFGVTSLDSYQICHENGLESDVFDIDIFLPLKDAAIIYDTGNISDSVTNVETNNISYDANGNELISGMNSISSIMLKNSTTTPVLYMYNTSGAYSAVASIDVSYFDFVESDTITADVFKRLATTPAGVLSIINAARANTNKISNVAHFSSDNNNIITSGVGLTYAVVTFTGKAADENADINGNTSIIKIILIESYVSPDGLSVTPLSDRNVSLFSADSVASRDEDSTKKTITINFANAGITYTDLENFNFVSTIRDASGNPIMTNKVTSGNSVSWTNGRYSIDNIVITDSYISFDIATISNFGSYSFYDELEIHYQLNLVDSEGNQQTLDMMWTTINITIRNAQRLTEVTWENNNEDGIYFEVGDREPYYIVLSTSPTNARNTNVSYLITDENGGVIDDSSFVGIDNQISSNMLGVSLNTRITQGMIGYIYILPEDAIYNGNIVYSYLDDDDQTQQSQISVRALGLIREGSQTWYDYLVQEAFFLSNTSLDSDATTVYFRDILLKIKITVADGSSFDYAYRIYDENSFINLNPELYYTVMNSLEIPESANRQPIAQFNGGLQGYDDTITIAFNGTNFAVTIGEDAQIRNITFSGSVSGLGFIANENYGTLTNVTVDVYQTYTSLLSSSGTGYVGGLVGSNYGLVTGSSVLGLTIEAPNATVGGIAGQNNGTISNSRVEFYNLTDRNNNSSTAFSTFTGYIIGGLVGQASEGSVIEYSYAYNYNNDSYTTTYSSVFQGNGFKGALVGTLVGESTIYYSFAVIDSVSSYYGNVDAALSGTVSENSDFYYSYYDAQGSYTSVYYYDGGFNDNSPNLVSTGSNFHSYVNGGNRHFRDLYQEEKVTDVSGNSVQTFIDNGYYKSLQVGDSGSSYGILFSYEIALGANDLTTSEANDLNALNTISLSDLVGRQVTNNIIITSSNTSIVRVIGSSLNIVGTGDVTLTISSKHDVQNNKVISIKVLPSLSQMLISYVDSANNSYQVQNGSTTYLQKTRTRDYTFTYENTSVILGNGGQRFELVQNNVDLTAQLTMLEDNMGVTLEKISNSVFTVTANNVENGSTQVTFNPVVTNDSIYQTAINEEFSKTFTIVPVDGVISFEYTGESLPLTPSTNAAVRVELNTTAESDRYGLVPSITYNGDRLAVVRDEELSQESETRVYNVYNYLLPQDYGTDNYILTATVSLSSSSYDDLTGIYSYIFNISFSVYSNYKAQVDEDMTFSVSFVSNSGSDSTQNGGSGSIELNLTRQQFTSIDVTNYTIDRSIWTQSSGVYVTQHTKGEQTSVVSPGRSSIMQISVNPSFAYYDYMTLSYSGATVSNAVSFELLRSNSSDNTTFIPSTSSDYYNQGDLIRFTPTAEEKEVGAIYIRVAISSTVNSDSTLRFTASFYESEGNVLTSVNYYLTISYLSEPTITVDGSSTAYLALGSTAEVEIQVREDQVVDSVVLDGESISGIYISSLSEPETDAITGIKTYTATLSANINASVGSANNAFYIQAQVSRTLNGVQEIKTTQATVVLVDFKIDQNNIEIDNANGNTFDVWYGVSRAFDITYNLIPETYNYDASDSDSVAKVQELNAARENFQRYQYYASYTDASLDYYSYAINYDSNGNPMQIQQRLWYVVDGEEIPITSGDYEASVRFEFVDNGDGQTGGRYSVSSQNVLITGTRMGGSETIVLKTYISLGDNSEPTVYNTYFTINVQTYSDPDLPVTISNATEFKNLNPNNYDNSASLSAEDYILMNDIVLENYTPFTTSLISSLDGNGYTIYIKSFDLSSLSGSSVNLALFDTVSSITTLRNVRVNVYNGGQITINLAALSNNVSINIAGLAITNHGTITNCEVVSYYTDQAAMGDVLNVSATTPHNNPSGINVNFIRGANTTENVYVTQNSTWVPQIAGFVINNDGSITNSRVGGESITILGNEQTLNGSATGYTYASTQELETFYIIGQGDMAGFVLSNSGTIAASFAKRIYMENQSNTTLYDTTGFVGTNSGKVITSYIEGVPNDDSLADDSSYSIYAFEGSSLKSRLGVIAGFVNNNLGTIQNSYSNILIANSTDTVRVYFASGFVYENTGTIEACYSASQIANSRATQMNFSGVDENGDLLANGTYTNCYFFNKRYSGEMSDDGTVESQYGTGAILIPNPAVSSYFYGFAVADGESDGVWQITEEGVTLIEPNLQSYSHRYAYYLDENSGYEGVTAENEQGEYIFRYAILQFTDSSREIDTALGSSNNPILITSAQDFVEVMGNSSSTPISQNYNSSVVWGSYRMVADIDLSTVSESIILPSTTKAFAGRLYGNGFTISNISIASEESDVAYGLFASVESRNGSVPLISNLNLEINQVVAGDAVMVGGLAGYIKDSIIVNIEITFNENSQVTGLNFVGGLVGFSFGNSVIKNIVVTDPYVVADRYSQSAQNAYFDIEKLNGIRNDIRNSLNYNTTISSSVITQLSNYSYAGSVLGFADNFSTTSRNFNINQAEDYSINNIRVSGTVYVQGQVAGGIFGLTGFQTNVRDAGINITGTTAENQSHIIATKYFAGGVVGQSFGALSRIYSAYDDSTQSNIENSIQSFYNGDTTAERGALDIFYLANSSYSQLYIGGIAGYVGSGKLEISYSKLNVTSPSADFAGGVIGGIDLSGTSTYQVSTELLTDGTYTKYFINEVYASGDVRARQDGNSSIMTAGGIIGVSIGSGNRIALLAVNSVNEIANYDYQTEEYLPVTQAMNISYTYKTNLILGSAFNEASDIANNNDIDLTIDNYSSYIEIIQLTSTNSTGTALGLIPTVAFYDSYSFNSFRITMNLFGDVNGSISTEEDSLVYAIASPTNFTNSTVGHTYTQQAFLSSGAWEAVHWVHDTDELFPSIRYQRSSNYIYLDAYEESIVSVFERLQTSNNDLTVVVRGRTSPDSDDSYEDIDLRPYLSSGLIQPISGFSGSIIGSEEYIVTSGDRQGERVRIISSESFIDSTGAGFYMNNVEIEYYTGNSSNITINANGNNNAGLFSVGGLSEATLSNLRIEINSRVTSTILDSSSDYNFGIIAPVITSSTLSNITITSSRIGSGSSIVNITAPATNSNMPNVNIGFLAGTLYQRSSISILRIEGIEYEFNGDLITLSGGSSSRRSLGEVNIGGYFGLTTRDDIALSARVTINNITKSGTSSSVNDTNQGIIVTSNLEISNLHMGGVIGNNQGVNNISNYGGASISLELDLRILSGVRVTENVYAGLVFGQNSTTIDSVNLNNSVLDGGLYVQSGASINNLYAGGFAGELRQNATNIRNIDTINFAVEAYVRGSSTSDEFTKDSFISYSDDTAQYAKRMVAINGNANVGVLVGHTDARFTFSGSASVFTKLNDNGEFIRISTPQNKELNVGSLIGKFSAVSATDANATDTLVVTNNIVSKANIVVSQTGSSTDYTEANVGGMIGSIVSSQDVTAPDSPALASKSQIGNTSQNTINYIGAVFSNAHSINFGGIVGGVYFSNVNDSLTIQNGVFGGALKVFGSTSEEVVAGGTVGALLSSTSSYNAEQVNVTITNNYNYGDVFVEYDEYVAGRNTLSELGSYIFGGVLGEISSGTEGQNPYKIQATLNYSLVTSHNVRYVEVDDSTNNALFGTLPSEDSTIQDNYYSSLVTLTIDDLGTDVGYYLPYLADGYGYNGEKTSLNTFADGNTNLVSLFNSYNLYERSGSETGHVAGQKLSPIVLSATTTGEAQTPTLTNGMAYYVIDTNSSAFTSQLNIGHNTNIGTTTYQRNNLKNVAIIGDGYEIDYSLDSNSSTDQKSLIDTLSGFSYVSGLVVNVDVNANNDDGERTFAGLANTMTDNATVYAVQVKGELSVGGTDAMTVAGLVGNVQSGKIVYATTSLDIIYRAGANGSVYGLAGFDNASSDVTTKFLLYSYSTGSISSYISANLYAVTSGASHTMVDNTYSIVKMTLDDYTRTSAASGTVGVFSDGSDSDTYLLTNSYYDYNALETDLIIESESATDSVIRKDTSTLSNAVLDESSLLSTIFFDKGEYDFNYGYPTLKYGFTKVSSFATAGELQREGEEGTYDYYVTSNDYTRLPNNTRPSTYTSTDAGTDGSTEETFYYIVPHAGILTKMSSITTVLSPVTDNPDGETGDGTAEAEEVNVGHFVLWYSIDISLTDWAEWESLVMNEAFVDFDGNENTLSNLNNSFFKDLGTKDGETVQVRNLRLTDVAVSQKGVLATTIYNAEISNMTISGSTNTAALGVLGLNEGDDPTDADYTVLGGLANEVYNSTISTVTNLVTVTINETEKDTDNIEVGGLVGRMENTTINYSSNYGTINVYYDISSTSSTGNYYVGGIVGHIVGDNNAINYSYNATSVMANYASASALSTTLGDYYVGGVAGYSDATSLSITGSYNAGPIKSGNKENGETYGRGVVRGRSYAAGIIAMAETAEITACYNEGSIEALGTSPTTEYRWNEDTLELRQTSNRNVWAYAIGYLNSGSIKDCVARDATESSIYMNGSMLDFEDPIASWELSDMISGTYLRERTYTTYGRVWLFHLFFSRHFLTRISFTSSIQAPSSSAEVYVQSYNSFGLPNSFTVRVDYVVDIDYANNGWWGNFTPFGYDDENWRNDENFRSVNNYRATNSEFVSVDATTIYMDYVNSYSDSYSFISNVSNSVSNPYDGTTIKNSTRSQQTEGEDQITTIDGQEYYLVSTNNANTIFNAGVYVYRVEGASLGNIPYTNDTSNYSVSATSNGNSLITYVNSVTEDGLNFTCYSFTPFSGNISYTIHFNYNQTVTFNMSNTKYYYINDNAIGIQIDVLDNYQEVRGYRLFDGFGNDYDLVIKGYKQGAFTGAPAVLGDEENENFVFFGVDEENGMLVYIPNATLVVDETERYSVNNLDLVNNSIVGRSAEDYQENVSKIIDMFNNQTYSLSIEGEETAKDISFGSISGNGETTLSNIGGGTADGNASISYGDELSSWYSSIESNLTYSSDIEVDITNEFDLTGESYSSYNVTLSGSGDILATYSSSGWSPLRSGTITVSGSAYSYTLSATGDVLTFRFSNLDLSSSSASSLATTLRNYLTNNLFVSASGSPTITNGDITDYASLSSSYTTEQVDAQFIVNLNRYSENTLILDEDDTPILGYSQSRGLIKSSSYNTIDINGNEFTVQLNSSSRELIYTYNGTGSISLNRSSLETILNRYKAITNDFDNVTNLPDLFSSVIDRNNISFNIYNSSGAIMGLATTSTTAVKNYSLNDDSGYFVVDGNQLRFNSDILNSNPSSLQSYYLNGIRVYYGTYNDISYTEDCYTSLNDINVTLYSRYLNENETIGLEFYVDSDAGNYSNLSSVTITGTGNYTQSFDTMSRYEIRGSSVTIGVNVCPVYELAARDSSTVHIALTNASGFDFTVNATISEDRDSITVDSISYYLNSDESSLVTVAHNTGDNGSEQWLFYDAKNNPVFSMAKQNASDDYTYYGYYNNSHGQVYTNTETEDGTTISVPGKVINNITLGTSIYSSASDIGNFTVSSFLNNSWMPYISDFDILGIDNDYIFIKDGYTFDSSRPSTINEINYTWSGLTLPSHQIESISFGVELDKFEVTTAPDSFVENQNYIIIGEEYQIYLNSLNPSGENISVATITVTNSAGNDTSPTITERIDGDVTTKDPFSIILQDDISFTTVDGGFNKPASINIIGNGYYISYYNSPIFQSLEGINSFIKDVNFLADGYGNALFLSGEDNDSLSKLANIAIYGSTNNYTDSSAAIINYTGSAFNTNESSDTNITIYASVVSTINVNNIYLNYAGNDTSGISDITLFGDNINANVTYYGFVSASNGLDGRKGSNGSSINIDGSQGGNGSAGKDIIISRNDDLVIAYDSAILKPGNGGNAGAGGSTYNSYGTAYSERITYISDAVVDFDRGEAGAAGQSGDAGKIILGTDDSAEGSNLSLNGINALSGAKRRDRMTRVSLFDTGMKWGGAFGTSEYDESTGNILLFSNDESQSGTYFNFSTQFKNDSTLSNYYTLTDDYATQFPKDEDGESWTGSNYAKLLSEANATD